MAGPLIWRWLPGVVLALGGLLWLGWPHAGDLLARLTLRVQEGGPLAAALFVAAFVTASVLAVPCAPAVLVAGFVYGTLGGFALSYLSATLAAAVTFGVGRRWLREHVRARLASSAVFRVFDKVSHQSGARLVFLLRLSPIVPFSVLTYAASVSSIGFARFMLASSAGKAPSVLAYTYVAAAARRLGDLGNVRESPWVEGLFWFGLAATLVATWWIGRLASLQTQLAMNAARVPE